MNPFLLITIILRFFAFVSKNLQILFSTDYAAYGLALLNGLIILLVSAGFGDAWENPNTGIILWMFLAFFEILIASLGEEHA